jgi:hypothetical protein
MLFSRAFSELEKSNKKVAMRELAGVFSGKLENKNKDQ